MYSSASEANSKFKRFNILITMYCASNNKLDVFYNKLFSV